MRLRDDSNQELISLERKCVLGSKGSIKQKGYKITTSPSLIKFILSEFNNMK